jgi:VWFA-related protein
VTVVDPPADGVASGLVRLAAEVQPVHTTVARVEFFIDGVWVCRDEAAPFECQWDAGMGQISREVLAVATLDNGSRLTHKVRTRAIDYADETGVRAVLVPVIVTDTRGKFVRNLSRDAFTVKEEGVEQKITYFDSEHAPLDLVVALDISDSMRRALPILRSAVMDFLSSLRPRDRITLVAFNDRVFVLTRGESDRSAQAAALQRIATRGGTALYDAIVQSLGLLESDLSRRAIVVFTDGTDSSSQATFEGTQLRLRESDAAVYAIVQGTQSDTARFRKDIERVSKASGGRLLGANKIDDLSEALASVRDELAHQYLLAYTPSVNAPAGAFRRITVEVQGPHKVRAREGYHRR